MMNCESIINPESRSAGAIQQTMDRWRQAIAAGDAEALAELVTSDAEFWSHGQAPLEGRDQLRDAFQTLFEQYDLDQEFVCEELVISGGWAFMRGLERNTVISKKSGEKSSISQRAFSVMREGEDGVWRFARGMTNLPPDAP